jgi:hypothetical protein
LGDGEDPRQQDLKGEGGGRYQEDGGQHRVLGFNGSRFRVLGFSG